MRAELAELGRIAAWSAEFARERRLSRDLSFAIQLCIEEALANIIMYSGAAEQGQQIAVELCKTDRDVVAVIEDDGRAFNPTTAAPRRHAASIDDVQIGELGIHLMRGFASGMQYERRDGRNWLTLRFSPEEAA